MKTDTTNPQSLDTSASLPTGSTTQPECLCPTAEAETSLDRKHAALRDYVGAVSEGGLLGLYVYGRPGTGKSFLVRDELARREIRYQLFAGHVTPKGLFQLLRRFPDALHVFDDVESLFNYQQGVEIFRAALASQGRVVHGKDYRLIRWGSWNRPTPDDFVFTGRLSPLAISHSATGRRKMLCVPGYPICIL